MSNYKTDKMGTKVRIEDIKKLMGRVWEIEPSEIPSDAEFDDLLQWDSMGHVALMAMLEQEYHIDISYKTLTELTSLQFIIKYLNNSENNG